MQKSFVERGLTPSENMAGRVAPTSAVNGEASGRINDTQAQRIRALLRARLGEEVYTSWFNALEFDAVRDGTVFVSVPVKFLRNWIQSHYLDDLLSCCQTELPEVEAAEVCVRQHGGVGQRDIANPTQQVAPEAVAQPSASVMPALAPSVPTRAGGLSGSPLDPRLTFETFVIGTANRMAHAAATQVAETLFSGTTGFNPLCIHSSVGLGKTHLLHAIAWEIRKRHPQAQLLYLTAERFRYEFVEALQAKDAMAFKERMRSVDVLLVDDLEFLHGQATEQEFDHIVNALLDGNRQLVIASSKAPNTIETLSERMRSRLQRGLVVELGAPDLELRKGILQRRIEEKRLHDPSFQVPQEVVELLAERLVESGRELEGAATKLHAQWQCMRAPITVDLANAMIRDLIYGMEPRRIRIEDILKVVSRHFGVSRSDILSPRRHRSVVWPRQIGMYLAKQLTARSLPEIGRRFGDRDHTTVLHAIRKIDGALTDNPRLRDEIDDLKKILSH